MTVTQRNVVNCLIAGAVGGLANGLALWLLGTLAVTTALGFRMAPMLSLMFLVNRAFWGGLWGLVFLLPILPDRPYLKGLVLSLLPSLVMLVVVFPLRLHAGVFGFGLGSSAPLFVLVLNAVWGLAAAWTLVRLSRRA